MLTALSRFLAVPMYQKVTDSDSVKAAALRDWKREDNAVHLELQ